MVPAVLKQRAKNEGYASYEEWERAKKVAQQIDQKKLNEQQAEAAQQTEFANQLLAFTQEHVPELHSVIVQIDQDLKDREARCDQLASDLRRVNLDPMKDPDLQRWQKDITEMKKQLVVLRKQREEAYIAFKKFELAPSGKAEYERKLRLAKDAAAESQEYHRKMQARRES